MRTHWYLLGLGSSQMSQSFGGKGTIVSTHSKWVNGSVANSRRNEQHRKPLSTKSQEGSNKVKVRVASSTRELKSRGVRTFVQCLQAHPTPLWSQLPSNFLTTPTKGSSAPALLLTLWARTTGVHPAGRRGWGAGMSPTSPGTFLPESLPGSQRDSISTDH